MHDVHSSEGEREDGTTVFSGRSLSASPLLLSIIVSLKETEMGYCDIELHAIDSSPSLRKHIGALVSSPFYIVCYVTPDDGLLTTSIINTSLDP